MNNDDTKQYEAKLRKILKVRRNTIIMFLFFIPYGFGTGIIAENTGTNLMYLIIPYAILFFIYGSYYGLLTCPRCGNIFCWRMEGFGKRNPFTKKCLNCGLELR